MTIVTMIGDGKAVTIAHLLNTLPAVPACDYWYEFSGKYGGVFVAFRGKFSDDQLRKIIHHVISHGYQSHDLKLISFNRTDSQEIKLIDSLKGY